MDLPKVVRALVVQRGEGDFAHVTYQHIIIGFILRALAEEVVQQLQIGTGTLPCKCGQGSENFSLVPRQQETMRI